MTGDGAVVRCKFCGLGPPELRREFQCEVQSVADLEQSCPHYWKAHARQQAAEIERLTEELRSIDLAFGNRAALDGCKTRADKINKMCDAAGKYFTERQLREASEARNADLLKALEQAGAWFDEYGHIHQDKPVPDADKAKRNFERAEFCWAAAKGGTV